jgi:HAD superfamily hydrolase (TIGR01490 family)
MTGRTAAFFDIDDTLIQGSTAAYLVRYLYHQRHVNLAAMARLAYYVLLYRLNRLRQVEVYRWGYGLCGDRTLSQVRQILDGAFERYVRRRVYRDGLALIERHRTRGDLIVAISGAPDYMVERVCGMLGIRHFIATRTPIVGDRVTRDVCEPLCYGAGKVRYATEFAAAHGVDLGASYFYSDSASDLPLLERVGNPIAVNPQRLLRRQARRRGWPIVRFLELTELPGRGRG